jgi:hypothetical protein
MGTKFFPGESGLEAPASYVFAITPDDDNDLAIHTRAIRANTAGDVVLVTAGGSEVTCKFAAGETRPIRAVRVLATDTTATGLEGMA